jgi:hypothetical protein
MSARRTLILIVLAFAALLAFGGIVASAKWGPLDQAALTISNHIYSYRGWQSTGIQLDQGDWFDIRAEGTWMYSPYAGPNGPEGHRRYLAPSFYPLPNVGGGALIGRVSEGGAPFYVGRGTGRQADHNGLLYLRIDDDLLGDNEGYVSFQVTVIRPTPTPRK